ncbi:MAG TPA: hypothetical protein PKH80_06510 [Methanofastidiosum sp.]|nr:hypothetical protein [Methanofastidiosum sp.]HNU62120.1 hypothetical protein [Methanofastidiosum sp.]
MPPYGYYSPKKLKMIGLGVILAIFWYFRWWILLFGIILLFVYLFIYFKSKKKVIIQESSFTKNRINSTSQSISQQNKRPYFAKPNQGFGHEDIKQIVYQTIKAEPEINLFIEDLSNILGFNKKEIKIAVNRLSEEGCIRLGEKGFYPVYPE